ncbi:MAG: DUF3489 domain-containing protein [Mesorhizobium sp.]|uniref:DUF3489 domain-containing protein n=1 Tax=Mesorhizobium sp. TaxID=1871066 RepID=UPI000FEA4166|nr:DUF3489 domain-containing protein [Mesorhizobium sp.]RWQ35836.1 MAG: DUF3489 domain-containing protein [Mesorhizobium sp.]
MKSYNVKSNAKRFARQLAAKFPGYIADEPMPVIPGAMEWFPHVAAPTKVLAAGIPEEISSTAYVNGKLAEVVATSMAEPVTVLAGKATGKAVETTVTLAEAAAMTPAAMKAAVADLPPTKSTPEEIAARRAARALRAAEPKPAKVAKSTKADTILELVSLADGATIRDIMAATDWQAHTVRGYIAGTLRKRGHDIVSKKIKGEETRYMIRPVEVEA